MRDVLMRAGRWLRTGWLLPVALLALPNCTLDSGPYPGAGSGPELAFDPGGSPADAILCDIPKPNEDLEPWGACATEEDLEGMLPSLMDAGVALVAGVTSEHALDWSPAARSSCPNNMPRKVEFFGNFPDGLTVCINCSQQIPDAYATRTKACIAKCKDLIAATSDGTISANDAAEYCVANTRLATNHQREGCYGSACNNGTPKSQAEFADAERRTPEKVDWVDNIYTTYVAAEDTLKMNTDSGDWIAGAASRQTITHGNAWVEFEVTEGDAAHAFSLRESKDDMGQPCADTINCPDIDGGINNIGFGLILFSDNMVYVVESSPELITIPTQLPYAPGDRFRIRVTDNYDGTATISYARVVGGIEQPPFFTSVGTPQFPLRVDSSLRNTGTGFKNVTLARIWMTVQ